MKASIAYGEHHGEPVHVSAVPSGLACACRCLNCGEALIARKGQQRIQHFAHQSGAECAGAVESALHAFAKHLLASAQSIWLPEYVWKRSVTLKDGRSLTLEKKITAARDRRIDHAKVECRIAPDFIPDVLLTSADGEWLFVEIVVTHGVDRLKYRKVRRYGKTTLVITLTAPDALLAPERLRAKIIGESTSKSWCFHPDELVLQRQFLTDVRAARQALNSERRTAKQRKRPPPTQASSALNEFVTKHGRYPTYQDVLHNRFKWS